ncbi:MAG: hypothetical protein GTN89_11780 [Acidobacteria bacterium]|nr:hypothetical protein [Acidobacteriota bacterium]NIM60986.1 hypothetical protein [Acidobacteriota bacterium]NIO59954.1 hypothetical protein [Acidobacteriota bacterium]NIQ31026.1 hypothetical protein [Acidobacteriota bacterium]NIQ86154.1 hypothetical protein [Acidobacteriota bacterium]
MKISVGTKFGLVLLLAGLLIPGSFFAQEDETGEDDTGWGELIAEYGTWAAEPGGIGDNVVSITDPLAPFDDTLQGFSRDARHEDYSRVGAELAGNRGRLMVTWYAHDGDARISGRDPGNFIFGQLLSLQLYAGLSNDGLADAFEATSTTALRDLKIEYSRVAFSNSRMIGRWNIGFRKLKFRTDTDATYYALVPTFPAFVPPLTTGLPDLTPRPETASLASAYEGTGLTGGLEFEAPLWRDKFSVEGSIGVSLLDGNVETGYESSNHYYTLLGVILDPPYDELADYVITNVGGTSVLVGTAASVEQETLDAGLRSDSISRSSQVYELSFGARVRPLRFMDVFGGYRVIHYGGVGVDLRPRNITIVGNTVNATDASETDRSATYRGFYFGVGFHF